MYFLLLDDHTSVFWSGVRTLFYSIDSMVYRLIIFLYNLFDMLCRGRILDSEFVQEISFRVGLILGLVMFFRVVFSLIQMLVNPDTINDKEKGAFNLVKRCLVTIVLLGVMPSVFDLAYDVQDIVLGNNEQSTNIIGRFLLPSSVAVDTERFGSVFSENLLFTFYDINEAFIEDPDADEADKYVDNDDVQDCVTYKQILKNEIELNSTFSFGYNCLNMQVNGTSSFSQKDETVYVMRYDFLLSTVVGVMVCWFLLTYCFSVGVRVVELAFLQIISPMVIISYISPKKDGMFQKWTKMCITTYLDMFIRVAIINFVILLISMIMESISGGGDFSLFWVTTGAYNRSSNYRFYLMIIIILSLLQFAKKTPDLIKEFFPNATGRYGFGFKNREVLGKTLAGIGGVAAGSAIGLVSGVAGGKNLRTAISGGVTGLIGGAGRGIGAGFKSKGASFGDITKAAGDVRKRQADVGARRAAAIAGGSTFIGRNIASLQKSMGVETAADVDTREIGYMDSYSKFLDNMKAAADNNTTIGKLKRAYESAERGSTETDKQFNDRKEALRKEYKNAQKAYISYALGDNHFSDGAGGFMYNKTGDWNDYGTLAAGGVSGKIENDDSSYVRQIVATAEQANNYQHDYSQVLGELSVVNDYGTMENNTNEVNARRVERQSTRKYAQNQANNKFSTKK